MKSDFSSPSDFEAAAPTDALTFSPDDLSVISDELWHLLNETLEQDLGSGRGETFEETIKLWRAYATGFSRRLMRRGWKLEDAKLITQDKNRLADMLERILIQQQLESDRRDALRINAFEHRDKYFGRRSRTISLM